MNAFPWQVQYNNLLIKVLMVDWFFICNRKDYLYGSRINDCLLISYGGIDIVKQQLSLKLQEPEQAPGNTVRSEPRATKIRPGELISEVFNTPIQISDQSVIRRAEDECEPGSADFFYRSALDHMDVGRIGNAIADLRKAVELMPDFMDAYRELGSIFKTTGQYEEALSQYTEVVRIQPDDAESRFALGSIYDRLDRPNEAIKEYLSAIKSMPGYVEAYFCIGNDLAIKGLLDEAIWVYSKVIKLSPDYPDAYMNMGMAMQRKGALDEAAMAFKETIRLQPADENAHYQLGMTYYRQGRLFDTMNELNETLRINPGNAEAARRLQSILDAIAGAR
jgi:tetratricopeptide (TPR) repeat protein